LGKKALLAAADWPELSCSAPPVMAAGPFSVSAEVENPVLKSMAVVGGAPVPVKGTVNVDTARPGGRPIVSEPETAPATAGEKMTESVQEAPAAIAGPVLQVVPADWMLKPEPFKPMLVSVSGNVAGLVMVTVWAALVAPTVTLPKLSVAGETVGGGAGATPVPVMEALVVPASLGMLTTPVWVPAVVGANSTARLQEAPGARATTVLPAEPVQVVAAVARNCRPGSVPVAFPG
jgi:hypothetical protein